MRKIKCCKCQKFIVSEDDRLEINGKDYHKSCYEKNDSEKDYKNELREYIKSLYIKNGKEIPQDGKINALILQAQTCMLSDDNIDIEYISARKLSFEHLYKIMRYAYEYDYKIPNFYEGNPFSIVPYTYYNWVEFEERCQEIEKAVEEFDFNSEVIVIRKKNKVEKKYKEIDMSTLNEGIDYNDPINKQPYKIDWEAEKALDERIEQLKKKKELEEYGFNEEEYGFNEVKECCFDPLIKEEPISMKKKNPFE